MILSMLDFHYWHVTVGSEERKKNTRIFKIFSLWDILFHIQPGWIYIHFSDTWSQWLSTTTCWLADFLLMESFVIGRSAAQKSLWSAYIYTWFGYKTQRSDCPQVWITFSCPPPLPRASLHPSVLPPQPHLWPSVLPHPAISSLILVPLSLPQPLFPPTTSAKSNQAIRPLRTWKSFNSW